MDQNTRIPGIGMSSKDPLRSMVASEPSKGGRTAATALGRPGTSTTHHDHVKRSSKDHNGKLKDQSRPQPRNENVDRERTKAAAVRGESSSRERPKAAAGGGKDRDQDKNLLRRSLPEKPKSSATRVSVPDKPVKKENLSSDRKPLRPENPKRPDGARAKEISRLPEEKPRDIVKKVDTKKRTIGEVQRRSVTKIEPVVARSNKNGQDVSRSVKTVTGTVMKAKQEKVKKKVFSLPGQRYEAPEERDALRLFYGSLHRQIPTSDMANIWLMEHGLLEADEAQKVLTQKVKSKSSSGVSRTPTPSKFSNGKSSKFKSEDLLELKPVSKKLKL